MCLLKMGFPRLTVPHISKQRLDQIGADSLFRSSSAMKQRQGDRLFFHVGESQVVVQIHESCHNPVK
jgi:hypothetical protein